MKIDRLIGIITVLLQQEKVTAPYLAERFEVSKRTINRDIETICKAGIPLVTLQGSNGGVAISDGYKIDKTFFTKNELQAVFAGLLGLDSIAQNEKYQNIIDKFSANKTDIYAANHIMIDLSSHYKNSLAPKIETLKQAIDDCCEIEFFYYNSSGERKVNIEPYLIVFQWSSWYIFGYELTKEDFRMFKLNRLDHLKITDKSFAVRNLPKQHLDFNEYFTDEIKAVILFDKSVKYRLIEEYGTDCYKTLDCDKLRFAFAFTSKEYLFEWVLKFGDKAELLEPIEFRNEIKNRLENSLKKYLE